MEEHAVRQRDVVDGIDAGYAGRLNAYGALAAHDPADVDVGEIRHEILHLRRS